MDEKNLLKMDKDFVILTIANSWLTLKLLSENINLYVNAHN
jgi:hypothetical protein